MWRARLLGFDFWMTGVSGDEPYLALVRGVLLEELGCTDEALTELGRAEADARNPHEAAQVRAHAARIRGSALGVISDRVRSTPA